MTMLYKFSSIAFIANSCKSTLIFSDFSISFNYTEKKILQRFVNFPCELIVLVPNMNLLQPSRELYTELARVKFYGH